MARKRYDRDFRISAVRLVTEQGYTLKQAAKSLGISSPSIREWKVKLAKEGVVFTHPNETAAEEIRRLRTENKRLQLERDILKKAATYFASQNP
jgi:transposase